MKGKRIFWVILILLVGIFLAFVMVPRFVQMQEYSRKASLKYGLYDLQVTAGIYYGDTKGIWPPTLDVLVPKYIKAIPEDGVTGSRKVVSAYDGTGGWVYNNINGEIESNAPVTPSSPSKSESVTSP